jgi:hypothetical protein
MGKKSGCGIWDEQPNHISKSLETIFWLQIFKYLDADPGSRMEKI